MLPCVGAASLWRGSDSSGAAGGLCLRAGVAGMSHVAFGEKLPKSVSCADVFYFGPTAAHGLRIALEWMRTHPASTRPVADLCDRLGVSPATLARLFKKNLGHTPMEHYNRLKIDIATHRLRAGEMVKRVALDLGYRHVHDFSRFFRRRTGINPARIKDTSEI